MKILYYDYNPLNVNIFVAILIIEIIAIAVIYKIFIKRRNKAIEEGKDSYNNFLLFQKNIKYWLWGNFFIFNIGFFLTITYATNDFLGGLDIHYGVITKILSFLYSSCDILICLSCFLISLIIKLKKRDLSLYYYGSIIFFSIIIGYPCLIFIDQFCKNGPYYLDLDWEIRFRFPLPSLILIFTAICSSLLGGGSVDIYRYFKLKYSKPLSTLE